MSDQILSRLGGTQSSEFQIGSKLLESTSEELQVRNLSDDSLAKVRASGLIIPNGAAAGYVLTSDANGVGSWAANEGGGGEGGTPVSSDKISVPLRRLLLEEVVATDGDTVTFDLTSSVYDQYDQFIIEYDVRAMMNAAVGWLQLWVNGDTTSANYGSIMNANNTTGRYDQPYMAQAPALTAIASSWGFGEFVLIKPRIVDGLPKRGYGFSFERRAAATHVATDSRWEWENTADKITTLLFNMANATAGFKAGSRFTLYGYKEIEVVTDVYGGSLGSAGPAGPEGPAGPGSYIIQARYASAPGATGNEKRIRATRMLSDTVLPTLLSKALTEKSASSNKTDFLGRIMGLHGSLASSPGSLVFSQPDRHIFHNLGRSNDYQGVLESIYEEDSATITTLADSDFWDDVRQAIYNAMSRDGSLTEHSRYNISTQLYELDNEAAIAVADIFGGLESAFLNYCAAFSINSSSSNTGIDEVTTLSWSWQPDNLAFEDIFPVSFSFSVGAGNQVFNPGAYDGTHYGYGTRHTGNNVSAGSWVYIDFAEEVLIKRAWMERSAKVALDTARVIRMWDADAAQVFNQQAGLPGGVSTYQATPNIMAARVGFYGGGRDNQPVTFCRAFEIDYVY